MAGYLRHAHEQTLITTIEEGRAETKDEFYRLLEERGQRDWEARKRRLFEELGGRLGVENRAVAEMKMSSYGRGGLGVSSCSLCGDCVVLMGIIGKHKRPGGSKPGADAEAAHLRAANR